jgi:transposase
VHASEQDRPDVRRQREIWEHCLPGLDLEKLVFLDESGVNTAMFRRYGRCPQGQRLVDAAPAAHWQSNTLLAAVRLDGVVAPMVLDGPVDAESFAGYVERSLVPELRPGDIVIMDNLPAHKGPRVARAIEAAGCRLAYLPPYSPDFNPIEPMWSKVKSIVRKAAARTFEAVVDAVRTALLAVTPDDCYGFFCHCGYDATSN